MSAGTARWSLRDGLYRDGALDAAGVAHGVTTRAVGDMKSSSARVAALRAAGLQGEPVTVKQVHGTKVSETGGVEADALVTNGKQPIGVYVADCMPVFAFDPKSRVLGLAHAGWRGAKDGVVTEMLKSMAASGADLKNALVSVGPHIGPCCFVVSPDTAALFPQHSVLDSPKGPVVDLADVVKRQAQAQGVPADSISVCEVCTASNPELFFSFRRDKSDARMLAFAALS